MKKILLSTFIIISTFIITGCGAKNYGIITDEDSNKIEEISAKDLIGIHKENEKKFKSLYYGKNIEITDKVENVMEQGNVTCLFLKNNWVIATHASEGDFIDFVSTLNSGNRVHISGKIYDIGGYCGYDSEVEINITSDSIMEIVK